MNYTYSIGPLQFNMGMLKCEAGMKSEFGGVSRQTEDAILRWRRRTAGQSPKPTGAKMRSRYEVRIWRREPAN